MLVVEFELRTVVELGVRTGNSTLALLAGADEIGGTVYSVDRDPCEYAVDAIDRHGLSQRWEFACCDALFIYEILSWEIDFLFVDLDHTYEETKVVLERYSPSIRPGGWMGFHDTVTRPDVLRALEPFRAIHDDWNFYHWEHNSGLMLCRRKS